MAGKRPLFQNRAKSAILSDCGLYRYRLERRWGPQKPWVFILINPSTADDVEDDPTVTRLVERAKRGGAGGIVVLNLFAFRSAYPTDMMAAADPIGPDNDRHLLEVCAEADEVICGWGADGRFMDRDKQVVAMLRQHGITAKCLQVNKDGTPRHPLYVAYSKQPIPYELAA